MKRSTQLRKELFEMVYKWGGYGIAVDYTAPAFKDTLAQYVQALDDEAWEEGDHRAQEDAEMQIGASV